ncbi:rhomboid family intramembrane serine protease [Sphingobacterium oryzagri]|uniref:Rhomboid family intramembrane serine protease n=1 Tax=Sphingobacterium oryzagri TaxID=3025669 RepID=A0ABY7WH93_9SPHI|nr:rhomboid family intramembrane serine protease [Sphingobacterium sp. KACC 22765]WDF68558.1 rhomboid family intramembrane serine protease [Sphingobacterium sp. KACC 22765]
MISNFSATPVATLILALTVGLSALVFSKPEWYGRLMLHPYSIYRDKSRIFTLLTSGFIHKDWMHLLFNMVTFYFFGFALEGLFVQFSGPIGHVLFAGLYVASLVLSDIPTIFQHKNNTGYYSLGASGAICAVLFSFILFEPKSQIGVFFVIPMPAYLFALLFLGYCIWASKNARDRINHDAHLYGAITGLTLTLLMYPWALRQFVDSF